MDETDLANLLLNDVPIEIGERVQIISGEYSGRVGTVYDVNSVRGTQTLVKAHLDQPVDGPYLYGMLHIHIRRKHVIRHWGQHGRN